MSRLRGRGWETAVFRIATAVALVHALDDAFLNRQPGVGAGRHLLAALIAVLAMWGFPRVRPGVRSLLAFAFGFLALPTGPSTCSTSPSTGRRAAT